MWDKVLWNMGCKLDKVQGLVKMRRHQIFKFKILWWHVIFTKTVDSSTKIVKMIANHIFNLQKLISQKIQVEEIWLNFHTVVHCEHLAKSLMKTMQILSETKLLE